MKLLFVNKKLGYQSTTTYTYELVRAILDRHHQTKLCTMGGELREWFDQSGLVTTTVKFNYFSFRRLMQFLAEFQPDLIHIMNLGSLPLGQRLSERLQCPHLVTVHRVPDQFILGNDRVARELPHGLLGGVIAVSENIRESLVNDHRVPKELIRVIPPGINLERFAPDPKEAPPPPDRIPVVGTIGRLNLLKGFHFFLAAARRVLDRGLEAMFVIVGEGEEDRALRQEAKDLGIEKHVTFAPPLSNIVDLYRSFDIVVVPTRRCGVGLTVLEAMAMAKPVVASAVGEILHLVKDGQTGFVVPEGDAGEIADRIIQLLQDPELGSRLGQAARESVEELYSLAPMVGATESLYREILEEIESQGDTSFRHQPRRAAWGR